ncbi:ComEC/Rec2 family competence protein [Rhizosphaericola mali]|uniref:ComEC/Rec2 family competence protein n=1 Tax=Rhizosphaericola mali TaxID=2545455 RepID=A0A5P2G4Q8_9BACT|nr:ComEC/Rec2 family competence protein [Rhizosphaericola mali]QES90806.1 ComEC/Rec2 family competence protein [Rhizosphaericola mali]
MKLPITKQLPLLLPLICLIIGIYVSSIITIPIFWVLILLVLGLAIAAISNIAISVLKFPLFKNLLFLIGILLCFIALGFISREKYQLSKYLNTNIPLKNCEIILQENAIKTTKYYRAKAYLSSKETPILIYLNKDLRKGDTIITSQLKIRTIANFNSEYDIKTFYNRQGYFYNVFIDVNHCNIYPKKLNLFERLISFMRNNILATYSETLNDSLDVGLSMALILGETSLLEPKIYQAYINTGTVHVIAVSGMHLTLLFGFLEIILGRIPIVKYKKGIRFSIVLLFIWLFTFLVGMGPSILRAAVMLTFSLIGNLLGRRNGALNGLLFSAFILLLIDPNWLWNIGFLLSYSSLVGILLWSPILEKWLKVENPILQFFMKMIAITLAAQLGTIPIVLYCFHQFPIWFLFFNIWMVPLSSVGIFLLLSILLFSKIPIISDAIIFFSKYVLQWMNWLAIYSNDLPISVWKLKINWEQAIVLYGIIGLSYCMVIFRKKIYFWYLTLLIFVFILNECLFFSK